MSQILNKELAQSRVIYELVRLEETANVSKTIWLKVYAQDLSKKYN